MIQLQLQVRPHGTYDIEAFVEYQGKQIDSHVHSSEGWLIRDWFDKDTYFTHKEKIFKALGGQPFQLTYKTNDQKEEYKLEFTPPPKPNAGG